MIRRTLRLRTSFWLFASCAAACGPKPEPAAPVEVEEEPVVAAEDPCKTVTFCFDSSGPATPKEACAERCAEKAGPSCLAPAALMGGQCEAEGGGRGLKISCSCTRAP